MKVTPSPTNKPLGCRLNINHTWRMEYPPRGDKYAWCVKCGKVNPNGSGRNWSDIFWVGYKPESERKKWDWFDGNF